MSCMVGLCIKIQRNQQKKKPKSYFKSWIFVLLRIGSKELIGGVNKMEGKAEAAVSSSRGKIIIQ